VLWIALLIQNQHGLTEPAWTYNVDLNETKATFARAKAYVAG